MLFYNLQSLRTIFSYCSFPNKLLPAISGYEWKLNETSKKNIFN